MSAHENKYLKLGVNAVLTPKTEPVIIALDPYFKDCPATVTSILRTADDQLRIIRGYLKSSGLEALYPEAMVCKVNDKVSIGNSLNYVWQRGWSALLNKGIIINPPLAAIVLMDYIGADGKNHKGLIKQPSVHFNGTAFDISGGNDKNIDNEVKCLENAIKSGVIGIKDFLKERQNNAIHINCL